MLLFWSSENKGAVVVVVAKEWVQCEEERQEWEVEDREMETKEDNEVFAATPITIVFISFCRVQMEY